MPKTSERQQLLSQLEDAIKVKLHEILDESSEEEFWWPSSSSMSLPSSPSLSPTQAEFLSIDIISSSSDWPWFEESSSDDELYDLLEAYDYVSSNRYLTPRSSGSSSVQKSFDWQRNILPYNDDREFQQNLRTTKDGFQRLYELIKTDPVFRNGSTNQQLPVEIQLGVTLYRMGSEGDDASVPKIARSWGLSQGAVVKCTKRVIDALRRLAPEYVKWPDTAERRSIAKSLEEEHGFPDCIGFLCDTDIVLSQPPGQNFDRELYLTSENKYAIKALLICVPERRIVYNLCGHVGSVPAYEAFKSSDIQQTPDSYFSDNEYIIADNAFKLSNRCITSYSPPASDLKPNRIFNHHLSTLKIEAANTIKALKGRFRSLNRLRVNLYNDSQLKAAVEWFEACVVAHNILLEVDPWNELIVDNDDVVLNTSSVVQEDELGQKRREELKKRLLYFHGKNL